MRALGGVWDIHHGVLHWPGVLKDVDRSSQALDNGPFHAATFRRVVAKQALVILDIRTVQYPKRHTYAVCRD